MTQEGSGSNGTYVYILYVCIYIYVYVHTYVHIYIYTHVYIDTCLENYGCHFGICWNMGEEQNFW